MEGRRAKRDASKSFWKPIPFRAQSPCVAEKRPVAVRTPATAISHLDFLQHPSPFKRPCERHLVGIFQIGADRNPVGEPADLDSHGL